MVFDLLKESKLARFSEKKKNKRTVGKKEISNFPSSSVALELWKMGKF